MIGYQYIITNKRGESITLNDFSDPSKVIALQAYPDFDVDIKGSEVSREGQHGVWDFYSYYGRRTIGLEGVIVGHDEADVEAVKNKLVRVLALPVQPSETDDGYVFLTWTDVEGKSWTIECKMSSPVKFNRNLRQTYLLSFNINLKSPTPFILSQESFTQFGTRGYTLTGGQFPLSMPTILGANDVNVMTIENGGEIAARTVIRLYGESLGAITNPTIYNKTTGKHMTVDITLADETSWIEIDSSAGTVIDNNGMDRSGLITGESEFISLVPGTNLMVYKSDEDPTITLYYPAALFSVTHRNTKI